RVNQATAAFSVGSKNYPAGSYVIKSAQAGRAHVIDMFEPQNHPNDMDERGIPRRPYDNAGWTLAYQMGVEFDRYFDDVTGPFQEITGLARPVAGTVASASGAAGYILSPAQNDAFTVVNRVLRAKGDVYRQRNGSFYVVANATTTPIINEASRELGISATGTTARPEANSTQLKTQRIALWDTQTGSMPSGWTRFIFEKFEFPFQIVCGAGFDDT